MNFIEEFKYSFKEKNNFNVLIYINLIIFIIVQLIKVILFLQGKTNIEFIQYLAVPANVLSLKIFPWTVFTYMFTHESFLHILFNLLAFYWFGKLFLQYLSQKQILGVYILGGLVGAIFYIVAFNFFPAFSLIKNVSLALGASASVMAVIFAIAVLTPNQEIYLMFFGKIKLKYLALIVVLVDILSIPTGNAGGHIAHLGGAFLGAMFTILYKRNIDITSFITKSINWIKNLLISEPVVKGKANNKNINYSKKETDWTYNARKHAEQEEINKILDKVSKSGYDSLSSSEKDNLFKQSKK